MNHVTFLFITCTAFSDAKTQVQKKPTQKWNSSGAAPEL